MWCSVSPLLPFAITLSLLAGTDGALAQNASAPSSAVEVAYAITANSIETWNVDPQTGVPTDLGPTAVSPVYFSLVPSRDDHFVYVVGPDPSSGAQKLWVYATNSNGVPQAPPRQVIDFAYTSNLTLTPNGDFAYAVQAKLNSQNYEVSQILRFRVDPGTGALSGRTVATKYPPGGLCQSQLEDGAPYLIGFNATGTKLYDQWFCSFQEDGSVNYYGLPANPSTGALGSGTEIFSWPVTTGGGFDMVVFTPRNLLDFKVPNDYQTGINSVNVYPLSGGNTPTFSCDAAMLEACGYGLNMSVDLTGKFIFLQISADSTQETRLDLAEQRLVATSYYLPDSIYAFSPDDKIIYAQSPGNGDPPYIFPVYTFSASTGALATSQNAQIYSQQYPVLVAATRK